MGVAATLEIGKISDLEICSHSPLVAAWLFEGLLKTQDSAKLAALLPRLLPPLPAPLPAL